MPDKLSHLITKPVDSYFPETLGETVMLGEQTKSEPAADDVTIFTVCSPAKSRTESSTRYWNGIKQYRSRILKVPVKRLFSPRA